MTRHAAKKHGRPSNMKMSAAFDALCKWLELCPDSGLYSLQDVHVQMALLTGDTDVYSEKMLKD